MRVNCVHHPSLTSLNMCSLCLWLSPSIQFPDQLQNRSNCIWVLIWFYSSTNCHMFDDSATVAWKLELIRCKSFRVSRCSYSSMISLVIDASAASVRTLILLIRSSNHRSLLVTVTLIGCIISILPLTMCPSPHLAHPLSIHVPDQLQCRYWRECSVLSIYIPAIDIVSHALLILHGFSYFLTGERLKNNPGSVTFSISLALSSSLPGKYCSHFAIPMSAWPFERGCSISIASIFLPIPLSSLGLFNWADILNFLISSNIYVLSTWLSREAPLCGLRLLLWRIRCCCSEILGNFFPIIFSPSLFNTLLECS